VLKIKLFLLCGLAPLREIYIFKSIYIKIINNQRVAISYIGAIQVKSKQSLFNP